MSDSTSNGTTPYGRRLIPTVIDEVAERSPDKPCFSIFKTSKPKDGVQHITFKRYANAINRVAHWIVETCGRPPVGTVPTIAYIGPNDARYVVMIIAASKAGYAAMFVSPRNPDEAQLNLFNKTDCKTIFFPPSHRGVVQPWLERWPMKALEVASLEDWFSTEEAPHFPYTRTFEEAEWEAFVVLHTSGSTGFPKPIPMRHGLMGICDSYHDVPEWKGRPLYFKDMCEEPKCCFMPFPLFHAGGIYLFLMRSVFFETPVALGVVDRPLSADVVIECLENLDVSGALLPPSILEDASHNPRAVELIAQLKLVSYGGGPLSKEAGKRLRDAGVVLSTIIGSTELCGVPCYRQPNYDLYEYFIINSEFLNIDWRKSDVEENAYQMVIVRRGKNPGIQGCFYSYPDLQEFDTGDLYLPHPTLADHWKFYGRSDNILVFSNGEKLNPGTIEAQVTLHPLVKGALVVGTGRFQAVLLLELFEHPKDDNEAKEIIDKIWPTVEEVNKHTVTHGQIDRRFILLSKPEKPFPRGGKGNVQRPTTIKLYQDEIDEIYKTAGEIDESAVPMDTSSEAALMDSIQKTFETRLEFRGQHLDPDTDFFSMGIDSLQVMNSSRLLRVGLKAAGHQIDVPTRVIYTHPSLRRLTAYIYAKLGEADKSTYQNGVLNMESLWKKYTTDLPQSKEGREDPLDDNQTILLTGSTGNLGSYLLDSLINNPAVKKVVCLNRTEDGGVVRQKKAMRERGLSDPSDESKVEFLRVDMSEPDFGLGEETYNQLLKDADRIIHNAWPVNFNMPLESFEPYIKGVRNIANFATEATKRVAVIFISSIGAADVWDSKNGPVPEQRIEQEDICSLGYGRSKAVSSLILEDAAKAGDFPYAIIRVGQIAGPEADVGAWNRHEMVPSVFASSLCLKALPKDFASSYRIDWIPVEKMASLMLEIAGISQKVAASEINGYYHAVNPNPVEWSEVAQAVQEFYGKERIPELVSFQEWVAKLEDSVQRKVFDKNPGAKLLDMYRDLSTATHEAPLFEVTRALKRSPTLRDMTAVTPELIQLWCRQWRF